MFVDNKGLTPRGPTSRCRQRNHAARNGHSDYKQPYGARVHCLQTMPQLACYTWFAVDNDHLLSTVETHRSPKNKPAVDSLDLIARLIKLSETSAYVRLDR